jgi:catechol 2,3-dioxygenase-like lactoylglutathione lyase family enzyme
MLKLDHLRIPVADVARSRDWYTRTLGLKVEFEVPDRQTVALQDTEDFTIFLQQVPVPVMPHGCAFWFQVATSTPRSPSGRPGAWPSRTSPASRTGATAPSWSTPTAI